jgi:ubiquinone/menaquinone biosynthesis C-methylase UbiE
MMGYFDHFAKSRSTKIGDLLHNRKIAKEFNLVNSFIDNKNIEILEIGSGKGDLAMRFIKEEYKNYDVVEPNKIMRDNLIKMGVRESKNYMIPKLKEKDNSYDLIICCDVFEHLNDSEEAKLFISEAYRVLRKKGSIAILSPDFLDWKGDFFNCDFSHSNITSVRRTIQLFYNNDISTLYYNYLYSCFEGILGRLFNMFVKAITYFAKGNSLDSKLYKLRLTFLRRFIIIGKVIK